MFFIKNKIHIIILWILATIPVFIWFFDTPLSFRLDSATSFFRALGQVTGIFGMTLFAINLILASRLKIFDKIFFGINKMYSHHHMIGGLAFSLLLFHPTFLIIQYATISFESVRWFMTPSFEKLPIIFGNLSLFVMTVALVVTFYMHLRYEVWKGIHKFLGLAFFLGGLHAFLVQSTISQNIFLKYYMLSISVLALASILYRSVFYKILVPTYKYSVREVKKLNDAVFEIVLAPMGQNLVFNPGQFAFVSFLSKKVKKEPHPFSMASSPKENTLSFVVKDLGDYTKSIGGLVKGDIAKIEGPYGVFSNKTIANQKQIWIAGGIGITPFLSMVQNLDASTEVTLFYLVSKENEVVYLDILKGVSENNNKFNFIIWSSEKNGRINVQEIGKRVGYILESDVFICGPVPLMNELTKQFISFGLDYKKIHTEQFGL